MTHNRWWLEPMKTHKLPKQWFSVKYQSLTAKAVYKIASSSRFTKVSGKVCNYCWIVIQFPRRVRSDLHCYTTLICQVEYGNTEASLHDERVVCWDTKKQSSIRLEGGTPRKNWAGCAAPFPKLLPYLWLKSVIFPTLYSRDKTLAHTVLKMAKSDTLFMTQRKRLKAFPLGKHLPT